MTYEEVLKSVDISRETLRRWVNAGLIPTPERGNNGRAGGRWSEYPVETLWEIAAASHLLTDHSMKQAAETRQTALHLITELCCGELEDLLSDLAMWQKNNTLVHEQEGDKGVIEASYKEIPSASEYPSLHKTVTIDSLVFSWLMARFKAEYSIPLGVPGRVTIISFGCWEKDNRPRFVEESHPGFSNEDSWGDMKMFAEWRVDIVERSGDDEIIIQDDQTKAALRIIAFKRRKA